MRKFLAIVSTCIVALFLFSCAENNNATFKGEIANLDVPYILASHLSADTLAIDTIKTKTGKFKYTANVDTLTAFTFYFNDFNSSAVAFADKNQKIVIEGDAHLPDLIQITGNEINNDLSNFKTENEPLLKERAELFNNIKLDAQNNTNNGMLAENDKIARINSLNHDLIQKAEDYIKKNPAKIASVILINDFFKTSENPQALERVLSYLDGDAAETSLKAQLTAYSNRLKLSAEGAGMPYFRLIDTKKDTLTSNDFKGKYLVLSFLSATGEESRQDVKTLKKVYAQLNKDSVKFISVYIDSDIYPITTIENDSIPWAAVPEKKSWASDIVSAYNIRYVPYNILISPNSIIGNRNIPAQEIEQMIKNNTK